MPRLAQSSLIRNGLAIILASASVGAVNAQVGAGPRAFSVYGGGWNGYLGVFPGSYNGFWSNGFSQYGPPVPTYGSVPGVFGGSDQRLSNFSNINIQNGAEFGLGTPGAGGGGPRRRHWANTESAGASPNTGMAMIDVRVPTADAEVLFEGNNTRQAGVRRMFQSPTVEVGKTYYYKVRAKFRQPDGTVADQERTVGVRANETTVVDFTTPLKVDEKQLPVVAR